MTRASHLEVGSCHDYRRLTARWRAVARASGLRLETFAESSGYPIFRVKTAGKINGGLYVSAGIHGDEPAGCQGLLHWAEKHLPTWVRRPSAPPLFLLPCLNPWGLINNRRTDEESHDLNRLFNRNDLAPISELKRCLEGRRFDLAIHLHEDYDAQGVYLYELHKERVSWGHALLDHCRAALPIDHRRRIDQRVFDAGLYLRHGTLRSIPGYPEALQLYRHHCPHVLTFETPSEFELKRRVRAQVLLIETCTKLLLRSARP